MKIIILGCGWYGCHCAMLLKKLGVTFKIGDIANAVFAGSSSKNQNRLHLGFHYPRSAKTRKECIDGYKLFLENYGNFAISVPKNYYLIDNNSLVDFGSYCKMYDDFYSIEHPNLEFKIQDSMIEGCLNVQERYIDYKGAASFFEKELSDVIIKNYDPNLLSSGEKIVYDGEEFDVLIDCTYSAIGTMQYEECISFVYKYVGDDFFAVTLLDGPYWSIYPYDIDNNLYTLTDVEQTPKGHSREEAEKKVKNYIKDFDKFFEYKGSFLSRKAKVIEKKSDDRSLVWEFKNKMLRFSGGKVTGMFAAETIVKELVEKGGL